MIGTTYGREQRRHDLEALDGAEHRDRRRDHAVAVQQRRAEDAERDQHRPADREARAALRRVAALGRASSAVSARMPPSPWLSARSTSATYFTETTSSSDVDDQRQHAEHVVVRRRHRVRAEEALAHRIQRAGADVAVDDAERGQGQRKETAALRWSRRKRRSELTSRTSATPRTLRLCVRIERATVESRPYFMTFLRLSYGLHLRAQRDRGGASRRRHWTRLDGRRCQRRQRAAGRRQSPPRAAGRGRTAAPSSTMIAMPPNAFMILAPRGARRSNAR